LVVSSTPRWIEQQASFSPDGSQVVYADLKADGSSGIYVVDSDGGTSRLLRSSDREFINPTFSPDGAQIAYFEGHGDWGNSLRVMNADGTGVRVLSKVQIWPNSLGWSPDSSRLFFAATDAAGSSPRIWVVGADGSDLTPVATGVAPSLSPDGSRLIFSRGGRIFIVGVDGSGLQKIGKGVTASWSPDGSRIGFLRFSWVQTPSPIYPDILHVHGAYSLFTMAADGSDVEKVPGIYPKRDSAVAWNPAG
jgi:Tol biopolymer transport system component